MPLSRSPCEFTSRICQSIKIRGAVISSEELALFRDTVIHYSGARATRLNGVGGDIQKEHCLCILMDAFLGSYTLADLCMLALHTAGTEDFGDMTEWLIDARDLPDRITQKSCWTLFWPFLPPVKNICSVVGSYRYIQCTYGFIPNADIPEIWVESSPGLATACLRNKRYLTFLYQS